MTVAKDATTNTGKIATGFYPPLVIEAGRVLAFFLFAGVAIAQHHQARAMRAIPTGAPATAAEVPATVVEVPPPAPAPTVSALSASEKRPAVPAKISYVGGQLRIDAFDVTLADVLSKVAALTGVNIEVPAGAKNERMPVVELGPGTARQVLAELLSDSTFDFLIQSSSADPNKLQSVLLIPRDKKGAAAADGSARLPRSPFARASAQPEAVPDSPQPETAVPESSSVNTVAEVMPAAPSTPPAQAAAIPDQPIQLPSSLQQDPSVPSRPGALAPPQTLSPQSINMQLQQMYQTRMQMIQPAAKQ
jgi:hypothetical protein